MIDFAALATLAASSRLAAGWIPASDVPWLEELRERHEALVAQRTELVAHVDDTLERALRAAPLAAVVGREFDALAEDEQAVATQSFASFRSPLHVTVARDTAARDITESFKALIDGLLVLSGELQERLPDLVELADSNDDVERLVADLSDDDRAEGIVSGFVREGVLRERRRVESEHRAMGTLGDTRGRDAWLADLDAIAARHPLPEAGGDGSCAAAAEEARARHAAEQERALRRALGSSYEDIGRPREVLVAPDEHPSVAAIDEQRRRAAAVPSRFGERPLGAA